MLQVTCTPLSSLALPLFRLHPEDREELVRSIGGPPERRAFGEKGSKDIDAVPKPVVVAQLGTSACLGEMALLYNSTRTASVTALDISPPPPRCRCHRRPPPQRVHMCAARSPRPPRRCSP